MTKNSTTTDPRWHGNDILHKKGSMYTRSPRRSFRLIYNDDNPLLGARISLIFPIQIEL